MFSGLRYTINPCMLAVATVMICISTALFLGLQRVQRRARMTGQGPGTVTGATP